ncbi:DUF6777 domain-containing protein [Actinomycetospora atypica]|uniref:DUF6777 domain-containing protein n=1 Tax=Actinomycetospora atypica TaxID=1290095 RepID=A0ABV9YMI6_9PSEU
MVLTASRRRSVPPVRGGRLLIAAVVVVLLGVAGTVLAATQRAHATLEPVNTVGDYAFFTDTGADVRNVGRPTPADDLSGNTPGLYATAPPGSCRVDRMNEQLARDAPRLATWAEASDVATTDVGSYLSSLTALALMADIQVTEHGYREGGVVSYTSVLQAGTAVLVDDAGVPAVKCVNGNPLSGAPWWTPTRYDGPPWAGFDATAVADVAPAAQSVGTFVVADPISGGRAEVADVGPDRGKSTVVSTAGAPWVLDPIEAHNRFQVTGDAVDGYVKDKCANPPHQCLDVRYETGDGETWSAPSPSLPAGAAACDITVGNCWYLHSLTYVPAPTKVVDGQRVPCDPEAETDVATCRLKAGTKVIVKLSSLSYQQASERQTAAEQEVEAKRAANPSNQNQALPPAPPGTSTVPTPTTTPRTTSTTAPTTTTTTSPTTTSSSTASSGSPSSKNAATQSNG